MFSSVFLCKVSHNFLTLALIFVGLCCVNSQDFSVEGLSKYGKNVRLNENSRMARFVDIYTNHPNLAEVEKAYSKPIYHRSFNPSEIDRKDTVHFDNIEDIFASPNRYNLESEYGEFDQHFGGSSIVNYYDKVPYFEHKNPINNYYGINKNYLLVQSQIVSPQTNKHLKPDSDKRTTKPPYHSTIFTRRKNISDFTDFGDNRFQPETTTRYSFVQKIDRYPSSISRYITTESPNKYEEIPIMTVSNSKLQKNNQNFTFSTRNKIAEVLRHYLMKLYHKKYLNTGENLETAVLDNKFEETKYYPVENNLQTQKNFDGKPRIPKLDDIDSSESKLLTGDTLGYLKNKTLSKINKFLSIFTVVRFNNTECNATTLYGTWQGLCYTAAECAQMGGISFDACAGGYGICCVFRGTCGDWSARNCTYFKSPNYPDFYPPGGGVIVPTTTTTTPTPGTPDPRKHHWYYQSQTLEDLKKKPSTFVDFDSKYATHEIISKSLENAKTGLDVIQGESPESRQNNNDPFSCIYSVYKNNPNIRQMRIDFIDLELAGPTNGTCQDERLIITGQNVNDPVPIICGYNTGQHIYVDVSQLNGPLQLMVLSTTGARKRFKIRICQYDDNCQLPNSNCLQYYTGVTGVIQSFNYDQSDMLNRSGPGYFNNLNYAICIRREAGYCSITYTNVQNGITYPFQLLNLDNAGQPTIPIGQAGVDILNCPDDYIVIDGTRLCGERFNDGSVVTDFTMNAAVTDTSAGPIIVSVRTDSDTTGLGFKLFYTQNLCTAGGNPTNPSTPDPRS